MFIEKIRKEYFNGEKEKNGLKVRFQVEEEDLVKL